jgi:multisubunit Na+/H+ antiporter MnhG subunit
MEIIGSVISILGKIIGLLQEIVARIMNALTDASLMHMLMEAEKKLGVTSKKVKKELNSLKAKIKKLREGK